MSRKFSLSNRQQVFISEPKPAIVWLTPPFQKIRLHVHQTLLSKLSYHPRIRCHMVRCGEVTTVLRATILLKKIYKLW